MNKEAQIDGPVAVIILLTIIIIIIAFLYPILSPILSWFFSLTTTFRFGLIIFVLLTIYILIKEFQPRSRF